MNSIKILEVTTRDELDAWIGLYQKIFYDPYDIMTPDEICEEFSLEDSNMKFFLITENNKNIGIRCLVIGKSFAYAPYGGLIASRQGNGIFAHVIKEGDKYLKSLGIHILFADAENPNKSGDLKKICKRRINFLKKVGYIFVDDSITYLRPATSDPMKIQDYLLFGFKFITKQNKFSHLLQNNTITKEDYRRLYLLLMNLEYDMAEEELKKYPAINEFLRKLQEFPKEKIQLSK